MLLKSNSSFCGRNSISMKKHQSRRVDSQLEEFIRRLHLATVKTYKQEKELSRTQPVKLTLNIPTTIGIIKCQSEKLLQKLGPWKSVAWTELPGSWMVMLIFLRIGSKLQVWHQWIALLYIGSNQQFFQWTDPQEFFSSLVNYEGEEQAGVTASFVNACDTNNVFDDQILRKTRESILTC